jgi:hypothetical protein
VAESRINFGAPAALKKYPSLKGQGIPTLYTPTLIRYGMELDECIREFMPKPESQHDLYEIRTASQPPLVTEVLSVEQIVELARLRDFL